MRLVFLGTPAFAVPSLEALAAAGHHAAAVLTQPDRPRGRGQQPAYSPVKEAALRLGLPVHQPERIRRPEAHELLTGLGAELMVVVGYGQIIPQSVIDLAPLGILNVHASLLPAYRGAAPIQWAVARGETVTGVTIMRIDAGLDTGDVLARESAAIGPEETAVELGDRLSRMGAALLVRVVERIREIIPEPQDPARATYAPILKKEDGLIDWSRPAREIHDRVRGFQPWPGAYTRFRGQGLGVWRTRVVPDAAAAPPAGTLLLERRRLLAACGDSTTLELVELQLEGRKRIAADAFINGQRVADGERLG